MLMIATVLESSVWFLNRPCFRWSLWNSLLFEMAKMTELMTEFERRRLVGFFCELEREHIPAFEPDGSSLRM